MQAAAAAAMCAAYSQSEMHTGATSGAPPTEIYTQAASADKGTAAAAKQKSRRRLSGLFYKLAMLAAVVMLAAVPASACSHGSHSTAGSSGGLSRHSLQHKDLQQPARRLQQAGASNSTATAAAGSFATVDYQTALQFAAASGADQHQGRQQPTRELPAQRTCAYDDETSGIDSPEVQVGPVFICVHVHPLCSCQLSATLWAWLHYKRHLAGSRIVRECQTH